MALPQIRNIFIATLLSLIIVVLIWPVDANSRSISSDKAVTAPEFTQSDAKDWLNSKPLTLKSLQGKVVLIDFWTFGCWNCYRSFPWLNDMEERLKGSGLVVVGVHTPEFDHEKNRYAIRNKIKEFELKHAVMVDNDMTYWRTMNNRYWPAYYLIDKQGRIRGAYAGETHKGDRRAKQIEAHILELVNE